MAVRDISRNMDKFASEVDRQISRANNFVGESFVSNARQTNTYRDQTANLRNSIGFIVIEDKNKIAESFGQGEGANKGKEAANDVASRIDDHGLILVAGMEYAAAVESRGYDVISNSVNTAKAQHQRLIKQGLSSLIK